MTKMKIYDYQNNIEYIDLPDTEILMIIVQILSGDETGIVEFVDGTEIEFDACKGLRLQSFYDGVYVVKGYNIKKWLEFVPTKDVTASYERQNIFSELGCEDND